MIFFKSHLIVFLCFFYAIDASCSAPRAIALRGSNRLANLFLDNLETRIGSRAPMDVRLILVGCHYLQSKLLQLFERKLNDQTINSVRVISGKPIEIPIHPLIQERAFFKESVKTSQPGVLLLLDDPNGKSYDSFVFRQGLIFNHLISNYSELKHDFEIASEKVDFGRSQYYLKDSKFDTFNRFWNERAPNF